MTKAHRDVLAGPSDLPRRARGALRAAAGLACLLGAGVVGAAGCGDAGSTGPDVGTPEAPVGRAAEALTTCVTLTRAGGATVADAQIANKSPYNSNFGASGTMNTGLVGSPAAERQAMLRFDLGSIPSSAIVTSATVTVYASTTATATVNVHRITSSWSEGTVTWGNFSGAYDSSVAATFSSGPAQTITNPLTAIAYAESFDVTSLAQAWVNGTYGNYGVLLEQPLVSGDNTLYRTSEWTPTSQQPSLSICYATGTANGGACSLGSDCVSGNCVDGVCCDTACSGTCVACTAAKKGSGTDGTCGPIAYQTDPDNECPMTINGCGSTGQGCNGSGGCIVRSAGAFCAQGGCINNDPTTFACDGAGNCVGTVREVCGNYLCFFPGCTQYCASGSTAPRTTTARSGTPAIPAPAPATEALTSEARPGETRANRSARLFFRGARRVVIVRRGRRPLTCFHARLI